MYIYVYTVLELLIKLGLFWFAKHAVNSNKPGWHDHPHRSNYLFYHFLMACASSRINNGGMLLCSYIVVAGQ